MSSHQGLRAVRGSVKQPHLMAFRFEQLQRECLWDDAGYAGAGCRLLPHLVPKNGRQVCGFLQTTPKHYDKTLKHDRAHLNQLCYLALGIAKGRGNRKEAKSKGKRLGRLRLLNG